MVVHFISLMDPTKRLCSLTGVTRFGNFSARLVSAYDCNRVMAEHCIDKIVNNTVKIFVILTSVSPFFLLPPRLRPMKLQSVPPANSTSPPLNVLLLASAFSSVIANK